MKTFAQYLTESEKTFDYRIKIVGDVPNGFMADFKEKLKKFEPVKVSDPKKTPIQSKPAGFPEHENQPVTIIDATFRYPATPPQITQIAELLGCQATQIAINDLKWSEGMDKELLGIADQTDLLNSEYPATDAEQRQLKKEHAQGNQQVVQNSAENAKWTVAGGKTKPAVTTNDLPQGVRSPMSVIKRPAKPETGFQK